MKKILTVFVILLTALTLYGCGNSVSITLEEKSRPEADVDAAKWSVLVYMCGDTGERASSAIKELCQYEYPQNVNIVIQTGGTMDWGIDGIDGDFLQRYLVQKNSLFLKDQKQASSMGSYETLQEFLNWGVTEFPADRYMLIVMGDGTGTETVRDRNFNDDTLNIEELSYAVSLTGRNFDMIGFDSSYMASFEAASALSPYADYMFASEEKCAGLDYGDLANCLIQYPYVLPNELGQIICDAYYDKCVDNGVERMATMSVIDLTQISTLAQVFDGMAGVMMDSVDSLDAYGELTRNMLGAQNCVGSDGMIDVGSMAAAIFPNVGDTAQSVMNAVAGAVIYNVAGDLRPGSSGLSIYYPKTIDEDKLNTYMKSTTSDNYKHFIKCIAPNVSIVDDYVESDYQETWAWCDYVGREFECVSYMSPDSRYSLMIEGDMSIVKDVRMTKYFYLNDVSAAVSLGNDNNLDCDWANKTYMDNVAPIAPTLNGHLVQADMVDEIRDIGKIYEIPVLINDELGTVTAFYSWQTGGYEIVGTWLDDAHVTLKSMDKITLLHNILEDDTSILTSKTIKPGVFGLKLQNKSLPEGSYTLEYKVEDIYFKIRRPDLAKLEKNGKEVRIYQ